MSLSQFRRSTRGRAVLVAAIFSLLAGCATAHSTTYRDGAYTGSAFRKIAVFARSGTPDEKRDLESAVCAKLGPESCATGQAVLPPIRNYTAAEVQRALGIANVDAVLLVQPGQDSAAAAYFRSLPTRAAEVGSTQHGNLALLGRTQLGATSPSPTGTHSTSIGVSAQVDQRRAQAALMDRVTGRLVWGGDVVVNSRLGAPVSTNALRVAMAGELATQLRAAGLAR